jgi:mannose-6-phosphate isomerase-like protein (cupin superfamily)
MTGKDKTLSISDFITKTPNQYDFVAPDGTKGYQLAYAPMGNMTSYHQQPREVSRAIKHSITNELWYILEGDGELWIKCDQDELITRIEPGISIFIPQGAAFQFRNLSNSTELRFVCVSMPSWPGPHNVEYVDGPWKPTKR